MWSQSSENLACMPKSVLACLSCRKRKVKCDRELPQCMACEQTAQTCNYPLRPMKPGPKIGTLQRQKRCRQTQRTDQRRQAGHHGSPNESRMYSYDCDFDTLDDVPGKEALSPERTDGIQATVGGEIHEGGNRQDNSHLNMHDLSFILHPSHESSAPDQDHYQSPASREGRPAGLYGQACNELGVSESLMDQMIRVYFDNMVAINLFHEPSFHKKLLEIPSLCQLSALLAAIAAYASRFLLLENDRRAGDELQPTEASHRRPADFVDLACDLINKALAECDDEAPPLCVIQALIIATHCQLTRGVRGKAWRSLGLCVTLAYETNLHLLDSRTVKKIEDPVQWQADEEKRRAFWAIWEMDVFASTIRRTPTAIDWRQLEILLPVDNADWFEGRPAPSCFMEADPNQRWKALQDSTNQSPKAWFLVINSLMKAAQIISSPRGVSPMGNPVHYQPTYYRTSTRESVLEARQKLETLTNAVRCFNLALPGQLQYRDQHLSFSAADQRQSESQRQRHCSIYNIFVMTQLARLMIHRYDAFRPQTRRSEIHGRYRPGDSADRTGSGIYSTENVALRHYFEAADSILRIVNQSCEEHIQYINPFLSSTIWLASAVQLVRTHFARTPGERSLIKSRFDVLYLTYKRCVQFWDTQTALQQNLEALEVQLEARQSKSRSCERPHSQRTSKRTWEESTSTDQSSTKNRQPDQTECDPKRQRTLPHTSSSHTTQRDNATDLTSPPKLQDNNNPLPQFVLDKPPAVSVEGPAPSLGQDALQGTPAQGYTKQLFRPAENTAMLDFMTLPQVNRNQISESHTVPMNPLFLDSTNPVDTQQDQCLEWSNFDIASGIYDLLDGWSTY